MQHIEDNTERNTENSTQRTPVQHQHTSYISVTYRLHTSHRIQNTEYNMQHTETDKETDTEQRTEYSTYDLHKYSFDFYDEYIYIKKLYNTAIYKTYTFWSPY